MRNPDAAVSFYLTCDAGPTRRTLAGLARPTLDGWAIEFAPQSTPTLALMSIGPSAVLDFLIGRRPTLSLPARAASSPAAD